MNVDRSYVARTLALANLAPDIVKLIWEGRQPKGLTLEKLRQGSRTAGRSRGKSSEWSKEKVR